MAPHPAIWRSAPQQSCLCLIEHGLRLCQRLVRVAAGSEPALSPSPAPRIHSPLPTGLSCDHTSAIGMNMQRSDAIAAPFRLERGKTVRDRSEKEDMWRKRLKKEKTPLGRLFCIFMLEG
ncbi:MULTISPECIES: hypothetical protein [Aeromonas]|uniref:hypothetical protein n=1 Tax=Aeromonas TaxID=642 RepID=UPI0015FF5423|nr:hypothetical protein [Aeromonas veronii]